MVEKSAVPESNSLTAASNSVKQPNECKFADAISLESIYFFIH